MSLAYNKFIVNIRRETSTRAPHMSTKRSRTCGQNFIGLEPIIHSIDDGFNYIFSVLLRLIIAMIAVDSNYDLQINYPVTTIMWQYIKSNWHLGTYVIEKKE